MKIRINDSELRKIIRESVEKVLSEDWENHMLFNSRGQYDPSGDSNWDEPDYYLGTLSFGDDKIDKILERLGIKIYDEEGEPTPESDFIFENLDDYSIEFDGDGDLKDDDGLREDIENIPDEKTRAGLLRCYDDLIDYVHSDAEPMYYERD